MTSRRQSKRESVIEKSLKLPEKLKERANKTTVTNPEPGPSVDKASVVEEIKTEKLNERFKYHEN